MLDHFLLNEFFKLYPLQSRLSVQFHLNFNVYILGMHVGGLMLYEQCKTIANLYMEMSTRPFLGTMSCISVVLLLSISEQYM